MVPKVVARLPPIESPPIETYSLIWKPELYTWPLDLNWKHILFYCTRNDTLPIANCQEGVRTKTVLMAGHVFYKLVVGKVILRCF